MKNWLYIVMVVFNAIMCVLYLFLATKDHDAYYMAEAVYFAIFMLHFMHESENDDK